MRPGSAVWDESDSVMADASREPKQGNILADQPTWRRLQSICHAQGQWGARETLVANVEFYMWNSDRTSPRTEWYIKNSCGNQQVLL